MEKDVRFANADLPLKYLFHRHVFRQAAAAEAPLV